jgi:hypothetical protein
MPLLEILQCLQQDFLLNTLIIYVIHIGDKQPSDSLINTPEYITIQFCQLQCTIDGQEDLLMAIL